MLPIDEICHKHLEGFALDAAEITALVRDWRKRGEALTRFACTCKVECPAGYGVPKECARWNASTVLGSRAAP